MKLTIMVLFCNERLKISGYAMDKKLMVIHDHNT